RIHAIRASSAQLVRYPLRYESHRMTPMTSQPIWRCAGLIWGSIVFEEAVVGRLAPVADEDGLTDGTLQEDIGLRKGLVMVPGRRDVTGLAGIADQGLFAIRANDHRNRHPADLRNAARDLFGGDRPASLKWVRLAQAATDLADGLLQPLGVLDEG